MISKKCHCNPKKQAVCKNCSRIVAKIMLKNEYKHLKHRNIATGKLECPAWYNFYSKNGNSDQKIIADLTRRIENSKYSGTYNKILFFDNTYSGNNKPQIHI